MGRDFGQDVRMARPLRFEYAGALYHVMARGDGGKAIFIAKADHLLFLQRLEHQKICQKKSLASRTG